MALQAPGIGGGSVVLGPLRCGEVVPFLPPEVVQAGGQGKLLGCGGVRRGGEKEQGGSRGRSGYGTLGIVKTKADGQLRKCQVPLTKR